MKKTFKCLCPMFNDAKPITGIGFMVISGEEGVPTGKMCFCDKEAVSLYEEKDGFKDYQITLECSQNENGTYNVEVPCMGKTQTITNVLASEVIKEK